MCVLVAPQFYATDAGRQHFANQLTSIRYCVQETCNFDVLYAYLVSAPLGLKRVSRSRPTPPFASQTGGNYDFNSDKSKNLRAPRRPHPGLSASPSAVLRAQARAATSARACSTR